MKKADDHDRSLVSSTLFPARIFLPARQRGSETFRHMDTGKNTPLHWREALCVGKNISVFLFFFFVTIPHPDLFCKAATWRRDRDFSLSSRIIPGHSVSTFPAGFGFIAEKFFFLLDKMTRGAILAPRGILRHHLYDRQQKIGSVRHFRLRKSRCFPPGSGRFPRRESFFLIFFVSVYPDCSA